MISSPNFHLDGGESATRQVKPVKGEAIINGVPTSSEASVGVSALNGDKSVETKALVGKSDNGVYVSKEKNENSSDYKAGVQLSSPEIKNKSFSVDLNIGLKTDN